MASVGYVPGTLTAVAGESCLALVETAPNSPAAAWIWQQAGRGASAQALLAGLLGAGFEGVAGFALLDQPAAGPRRLFCRGAVAATVVGGAVVGGTPAEGAASARIDGVGLLTWREHVVAADAERIYLGHPPDEGALWLPAAAGVLLARCLIVDLAEAAAPGAPRPGVRAVGYQNAGSSGAGNSVVDSSLAGSPGGGISVAESPGAVDSGHDGSGVEAAVEASPDAVAAVEASTQPDDTEVAEPAGGPDRPSEPAIRPDAAAGISGPPAPDGWFQPSGASRDPAEPADRMPEPPVPTPPAPGPDEDGFTVEQAEPRPESPSDRIGPDVPALICPAGHVNSPSEVACRQCGADLPVDPVIVARPVLGVLRLSTGDVVTLDRDVVLGRNPPDGSTGANGEDRPHVVRLPSADGEISRTHLRVTLSGWQVFVTDLNSTNGTMVTAPGRDPEQLPPDVPVPIKPGTVVALAGGVDFRFEDAGVS